MADLRRILYVEDEPDIRAVAELALSAVGGFEVRLCESGTEAIGAALDFRPDFILLDVMMPGMDGPETLKSLRSVPELAVIPVAFMTAKVQPSEIEGYKALGASDVIAKPFDPMTLADTVRKIWTESGAG
ncbi:response regulator [Marinobacter caseinilyticus]|uniref:response regulator n=1 Tax=Marinobacter caseinilyticus TaxID=2692195 RepID=UPI00140A2A47|nr:response regulator [Marinobacter caseinilyticus]